MPNETRFDHPLNIKLRPGHFRNLPALVLLKLEEVYGGILDAVLSRCYTISSSLDRGESIYLGSGMVRVTSYKHGLHIENYVATQLYAVIWTTLFSGEKSLWVFESSTAADARAIWNKLLEYMELTKISAVRADELNTLLREAHCARIATCCIYCVGANKEHDSTRGLLAPAGVSLDSLLLPMLDGAVQEINTRNGGDK